MNKPAPKEPSMDEILSSIRQIIADDDAAGVPRRPNIQAAPPPMQAAPSRALSNPIDRDLSDMLDDVEPLALSPTQIIDRGGDSVGGLSFDSILADAAEDEDDEPVAFAEPELIDPEDIAFDSSEEELPAFDPPPLVARQPAPSFNAPRPQPTAPLPDPTLSSDMADQLLEPATQAAVRSSITRLNGMGLGNTGATIESLMRDMLRPMLKEWLDENLPSVVERMVEKEISRVSRGE
ncbi:DUF2497 domain-containing protein [Devosia sp. 2618]|uniref:PopZ family protein n=1 Tax=Devosia sp. 2618 TaxID=3156454 RepID=UPI003390873D